MSLWKIAWRSIQQRSLASVLTGLNMALGVALVCIVLVVLGVIKEQFEKGAQGYHLIVGAKGGKLQLVLNTVYHLSQPIENIPYSYYKKFTEGEFAPWTEVAIPCCMGDSYPVGDESFRVVGTTPDLFEKIAYATDPARDHELVYYEFSEGRNFKTENFFEAVVGSVVANKAGLKIGDTIQPTHNIVDEADDGHVHEDEFEIVGILAPTGTPNDRAVFVNIEGFYLLEDHAKPAENGDGDAHDDDAHDHDAEDEHSHESDDHEHGDDHAHHDHSHDEHGGDEHANDHGYSHAEDHGEQDDASDAPAPPEPPGEEKLGPSEVIVEGEGHDHAHAHNDHDHAHDEEHGHDHGGHDSEAPTPPEPPGEEELGPSEVVVEGEGHDHAHGHGEHDHGDHGHDDHAHGGHDEDGHGHHHHHGPLPEDQREVTSILVLLINAPISQQIYTMVNEGQTAQAVYPTQEIARMFSQFVGPSELILLVLAVLIVIVAGVSILVSIYNSMSERRHELAVMRALGAGRSTLLSVILLESIIISLAGGLFGFLLGHGVIGLISPMIVEKTGVSIGFLQYHPKELVVIPGVILLAIGVGFLPALAAYRTDVAKALSASP